MVPEELLIAHGGTIRNYLKNQPIFFEDEIPLFYYQIIKGSVRMVNVNDEGKEFIQGIFKAGQSFGEPLLFIEDRYPASAISNEPTSLMKISKQDFLAILKEHRDIHLAMTIVLAKRLYEKSLIAKEIAGARPEHRIDTVLRMLKKGTDIKGSKYKVEYSRQQIADMTGLRVETVIRSIKNLERKGVITIEKGKIYL